MDILITGRLQSISASFIDKLTPEHKVILMSDDVNKNIIGKRCKYFDQAVTSQNFMKLFSTYSFDSVIYFAGRPDENGGYFGEIHDLEAALELCSDYDIDKFVFISSTYVYQGLVNVTEKTVPSPIDSTSVLLNACEQLCEIYKKNDGMSILTLRVPCLFGLYETSSIVGNIALQIATKSFALINGSEHQPIDFLSQEDLGELVKRVHQDWPENIQSINVPGARQLIFSDFSVCLRKVVHSTRISFSEQPVQIFPPIFSDIAKKEFDWTPIISIEDEIEYLIENVNNRPVSAAKLFKHRVLDLFSSKSAVVKTIEIALGYMLMEFLNKITATTAQFHYIDFRLLFIVLMGTIYGLGTGFAAAILASVSLVIGYMSDGMDWRFIIYNIDNWLPFALYFIIGAITGYTKDKHTNDYTYLSEEKNDLERRYRFLNEVYNSSIQNKKQYRKQIISYRDSFGRIFDITQKLNTTLPDLIFKEALLSLEDILENQSISIYSLEKGSVFGRLRVCSKKILESAPKSLDLNNYDLLIGSIKKGQVWRNVDRIHSYPDYVYPIFKDETLMLLVMINRVSYDQMATYFENLLKIVCSLIEVSLLRAQQYNDRFPDEFYLPDSRILNNEAFKDVLRVRVQMAEAAISEYSLISVEATPETMRDIAMQLQGFLRESDVIGEGEAGTIYIILSQTKEENIPIVLNRLKSAGMQFKQITDDEIS